MNQYAPPDAAPTARLLGDLAAYLEAGGQHTVEILSDRRDYRLRPEGQGTLRRLGRELRAILNLLRIGLRRRRGEARPAVVLAFSSPPLLLLLAWLVARRHRARLAHWAMDLYPELATALMQKGRRGLGLRLMQAAMGFAYRSAALVVALDGDMRRHLQETYGLREVKVLPPWPSQALEHAIREQVNMIGEIRHPALTGPVAMAHGTEPWRWLYSGNLGRAHEWVTLLQAQRILEARGLPVELVFQGGGNARARARERAVELGLKHCQWQDYVAESELVANLLAARVLVVTQRPETRGLLWPSKLAVLRRLPRPILFVGPTQGAIAAELQAQGGAVGIFEPGCDDAVAEWIGSCYQADQGRSAGGSQRIVNEAVQGSGAFSAREAGCQQWAQWLRELDPCVC